ncbi:MAG: sodium:solute symporter, partial [Alistipes sp.]|nr:sodium:solute symporter [Alistipes sp.]
FAFGLLTRRSIREQGVWSVVLVAPILSALLQGVLLHTANYAIGFELILYNALFTMGGLWILSKRQNKNQ